MTTEFCDIPDVSERTPPIPGPATSDALSRAAQMIDDLDDEATALGLLQDLLDEQVLNDFALGGVLHRLKEKQWFGGFSSLEELCLQKFGFKKSKAYSLINVHIVLRKFAVPWNDVRTLGRWKLRLLCAAAAKKDYDAKEFSTRVEKAIGLTGTELKSDLRAKSARKTSTPSTVPLKSHADQLEIFSGIVTGDSAIDDPSRQAAIATVCEEFIANSSSLPGAVIKADLPGHGSAAKGPATGWCVGYSGGPDPTLFVFHYPANPAFPNEVRIPI